YSTGWLDGVGYSYSANLLTNSRVLSGVLFDFGPADQIDAIGCAGQEVMLPQGQYSSLMFLATGIQGNQVSQTFTVHYTDTTTPFAQSLSDWYTPQTYPGESEAVAMAYRNFDDGTKDNRTFNLYCYRLAIDSGKTVQSVSLPNNPNVVVLAITLVP
ncbi:MAG: S53 family peptidase, partial [Bryobacteraceae bacterium]